MSVKKVILDFYHNPETEINNIILKENLKREDIINIIHTSICIEFWYWENEKVKIDIDSNTEEFGRKCFYEGRLFKHPTYNGYLRFLEAK